MNMRIRELCSYSKSCFVLDSINSVLKSSFNRWIMYIEKKICECDGTIIMYHENIRRIKRR